MPPDLGQESDINSAWNAVILIRTTGSVQFYLSDWILLNKNERESSPLLGETGEEFSEEVWSILYQVVVIADLPSPQTLHQILVQDS